MEITTMQMYWLVMLDNLIGCLVAIVILCGLYFILGVPALGALGKEEMFLSIAKKISVVMAASILVIAFTPSTKQMAAILIVPRLVNSEKVQTIGNKVYDLAVEWMEELKPNKKESEV